MLALANALIIRWPAGVTKLVARSAWIYRDGAMREVASGVAIPELAPRR